MSPEGCAWPLCPPPGHTPVAWTPRVTGPGDGPCVRGHFPAMTLCLRGPLAAPVALPPSSLGLGTVWPLSQLTSAGRPSQVRGKSRHKVA